MSSLLGRRLERRHDVNAKDKNGRTPLSWAAQNGHEAVVKLLLDNSSDVDSKDNADRTPLTYICCHELRR
jgi:ankyrin repeat protein